MAFKAAMAESRVRSSDSARCRAWVQGWRSGIQTLDRFHTRGPQSALGVGGAGIQTTGSGVCESGVRENPAWRRRGNVAWVYAKDARHAVDPYDDGVVNFRRLQGARCFQTPLRCFDVSSKPRCVVLTLVPNPAALPESCGVKAKWPGRARCEHRAIASHAAFGLGRSGRGIPVEPRTTNDERTRAGCETSVEPPTG
eukprot:scaffold8036_cov53-Phaeocystis_antarctica.AAC.1